MADIPVERIEIVPANKSIKLGESFQLTTRIYPENATAPKILWSTDTSSSAKVTVDKNGVVKGISVGKTEVSVRTDAGLTATANISVVNSDDAHLVEWILIEPVGDSSATPAKLEIGDKKKFTARVHPAYATCKDVVWYCSQDGILSIDKDGTVTALKKGTGVVIAKSADGNAEKWCWVSVVNPNEKSSSGSSSSSSNAYPVALKLSHTKIIIHTEQVLQIEGSILLSNGELNDNIGYSQSGEGTINFQGLMGYTDNDPTRNIYNIRGSHLGDLEATFFANKDKTIREVVPVSVVYRGNETSTEKKPVKGLAITGKLELEIGERGVIKHTVAPFNASNQKVRYVSSNDSVATVDSNGNVTAVSNGKASIVVTTVDNNYSLTCDVIVGKGSYSTVTGIELSKTQLVLAKGDVEQVKATVFAEGKQDTAGVTCSSLNPSISSLAQAIAHSSSSNQSLITVKAHSVGRTTFTVNSITDPTKTATFEVVVVATKEEVYTPVLYVQADPTSISVPVNTEFTIIGQSVIDVPESYPSRYAGQVDFSTSDSSVAEIVRVYTNTNTVMYCQIKSGSTPGQATITVTSKKDSTKTATCKVYVGQAVSGSDGTITNPVQSVSVAPKQVELAVGDYYQLSATVTGQFTDRSITNPNVIWSSSTSNVFVNDYGRVQAIKVGTSIVTAVSQENNSIYDYCSVTVRERTDDDGPIILPDDEQSGGTDTIVRIDYNSNGNFEYTKLFEGNLGFDLEHPIESVVYHETEDIQKIYWVDGKNVLRFMNFMEEQDKQTGLYPWQYSANSYDNTYFDSNRQVNFDVRVTVTKDNSGNTRPNGVVQYLLTYYNKHGQETGYVWVSDLIYLSPTNSGGAADGTNMNSVTLRLDNLDTRFSNFRIYSVFRSSLNGTTTAYIVYDGSTSDGYAYVVDNNSHLVAEDSSRLLYLGSQDVKANTITHKDQTLFLGDLQSVGKNSYSELENEIRRYMFVQDGSGISSCISFEYSSGNKDIPFNNSDTYVYESQLVDSSSQITTFKGGEKYRFALCFRREDGTMTEAFWIGDAVNNLYPVIDGDKIHRVIAKCTIPSSVAVRIKNMKLKTANLMIAEATYADRSVKAQGILNPTVFNVWDRYKNRLYSSASWITRPRQSEYAWKHFEPIKKSTLSTGEIQCNYWTAEEDPTPYYILKDYESGSATYTETFDSGLDFDYFMVIYGMQCRGIIHQYSGVCYLVTVKMYSFSQEAINALNNVSLVNGTGYTIDSDELLEFTQRMAGLENTSALNPGEFSFSAYNDNGYFKLTVTCCGEIYRHGTGNDSISFLHTKISEFLLNCGVPSKFIVKQGQLILDEWSQVAEDHAKTWYYFQNPTGTRNSTSAFTACDFKRGDSDRWYPIADVDISDSFGYMPSYYKKHLIFIDENTITLNSPEFDYEAVLLDDAEDYKLRIVGVAKITENIADYVVEAEPGKLAGENLVNQKFSSLNGLISWPLWREYGYEERTKDADGNDFKHMKTDQKFWTSKDYIENGSIWRYWLYMWNHPGSITTFVNNEYNDNGDLISVDENKYSVLKSKTFANLKYSSGTMYNNLGNLAYEYSYELDSLRSFNYTSSQYVGIKVGKENRHYNGTVEESLSMPARHVYPIVYSSGFFSNAEDKDVLEAGTENTLFTNLPISISYASNPHVVMTLRTDDTSGYNQTILPQYWGHTNEAFENKYRINEYTGAILPWIKETDDISYPFKDYYAGQGTFKLSDDPVTHLGRTVSITDKYLYIGEIYYDFGPNDTRYGGVTDSAVQNNRFILAGPQYLVSDFVCDGVHDELVADQGDTYFQRWDCLKTKPYSTGAENNVIDVTSVMVETHVNIDGRTDIQRGTSYLASIDTEKFGQLNPVYSQHNNFITQRDLDEDFNLDAYRSSITWTLEKHDSADIDEWTHITLASTLKLDGDKGVCQALRRFGNSIIAFQDRGISEILFNSRTQLTTQDGVPVEIANSGKVDGKRYITNKFGCTNKWSIIEGKSALYFVDNINKAFCAFGGQGIEPLSDKLGFGTWFRRNNKTEAWNPAEFNNIVAFYDKIHSDIYLVKKNDSENQPCLVYNEALGTFTSFFDYARVPMMTNVDDRFVSFRDHKMWRQNEGMYCNFFNQQYGFWVQYRVTPEPFSDKIWTNIDYRADFYEVLNSGADAYVPEECLINGDVYDYNDDLYKEWETFTDYRVWDEYQDTGYTTFAHEKFDRDDVRKKFRIWRLAIPRALKEGTNKHGMDRIRNPWINLLFRKEMSDGKYLMQLHDIVVKYFE